MLVKILLPVKINVSVWMHFSCAPAVQVQGWPPTSICSSDYGAADYDDCDDNGYDNDDYADDEW